MSKHTTGLDPESIRYAFMQTAKRSTISSIVSMSLCILAMQLWVGFVHPLGVICAFTFPLLLSTPTTLIMHLKNQQLRAANKLLNTLASTDCLTSALNRRAFSEQVEAHLNVVDGTEAGQRHALLLLDVDNFKSINDTFGHEAGDITLQIMVRSIREHFGYQVPFGRLGGEEFAMFITNLEGQRACEIANQVREHVSATNYGDAGIDRPISVSIGVATANEATTLSQLLRIADQKMYRAKSKGRNRVESSALNHSETSKPKKAA